MSEHIIDVDGQQFYTGLEAPTPEEVQAFEEYADTHRSRFAVLGTEQYAKGSVIDWDDPDFQAFLDERIEFAKKQQMILCPPANCLINQSSLGSCSGASATGAQMSAVYNSTLFGVPAVVPRLNCMIMYVTARGSYGSGTSIVSVQKTIMAHGNASVESAGEYKVQKPTKLTGFDNEKYQCCTCNVQKLEQVEKLCKAGIPVCFGSNNIPKQFKAGGRVAGWGSGCLPADTLTYTNLGWKRIDEIEGQRLLFLGVTDNDTRRIFRYGYSYHTGRKPCVRVTTYTDRGNRMSVVMSADHYVQLTSGNFVKAGDLLRGQCISQVRVYQRTTHANTKYASTEELIMRQKHGGKRHYPIHRLIAEAVFGDITGKVVHHIDGNHRNNAVDNLELTTQGEHIVGHGNPTWQMHEPESWQRNRENMKATWRYKAQRLWLCRGFDVLEKYPGVTDEAAFCRLIAEENNLCPRKRKGKYGVSSNDYNPVVRGINKAFGSFEDYYMQLHTYNHVVVRVEEVGEMDCYDVAVECDEPDDLRQWSNHNFIIDDGRRSGSGLVVHNSHAMAIVGYHHKTGLCRWTNTWGIVSRTDEDGNGWGAWMSLDELAKFSMFSRYGDPYAIIGQECQLRR